MHFNKRNSNSNQGSSQSLLSSSSAAASQSTPSSSCSPKTTHGLSLGLWCFLLVAVVFMAQQQPCECRYLPTRSHGDDLDKLRELMLQILESSNEDQRPANEANGNTMSAQRANWLNKLGGGMEGIEARKFAASHGVYDNGRYY